MRYTIYALVLFVAMYIVSGEISLMFGCRPLKKLFYKEVKGTCVSFVDHVMAQAILNIVSDLALFILPIPTAWKLQLPKRQKIAIIAIFMTASV